MGEERRAGRRSGRSLDVLLARLATRQSGVVGYAQLQSIGFSRNEVDYRVATGRLIRIHRGVYAVGHEDISDRGRVIAGLLAAGPDAAASHRTAAALWKILPSMPQLIEVTLTTRVPRQREGMRIHQALRLDTTRHEGLPVTTPRQTLRQLKGPEADRATSEALPALKQAGFPAPIGGHPIGRYTADFFWPDHRLVVETDGWQGHGHRMAFEHDRARDAWLQASGYTVVRFTWRQVMHETLLVTVRIAQLLARTPHHALATPPAGG
jgi:hypothetical protein